MELLVHVLHHSGSGLLPVPLFLFKFHNLCGIFIIGNIATLAKKFTNLSHNKSIRKKVYI